MLQLNSVTQKYICRNKEEVAVFTDLSLSFPSTGFVMVHGISGSGKSTLINILSGRLSPAKGEVLYCGHSIYKNPEFSVENYRRFEIAYVDQDSTLLQDRNVYENIILVFHIQNRKIDAEAKAQIDTVLEKLDILDIKKSKVSEISGGQRQRVCLGIAILKKSKIIFADESTASLDETNAKQVLNILKELSKECLVVYITHQIELVMPYANSTLYFDDGELTFNQDRSIEDKLKLDNKQHPLSFRSSLIMQCFEFWNVLKQMWISLALFLVFLLVSSIFSSLSFSSEDKHLARELNHQQQQCLISENNLNYDFSYKRVIVEDNSLYPTPIFGTTIDEFLLKSLGNQIEGVLPTKSNEINVCRFLYDLLCDIEKKNEITACNGYDIVGIIDTPLMYKEYKINVEGENKATYLSQLESGVYLNIFFADPIEEEPFDYILAYDNNSSLEVSNLILNNLENNHFKNQILEKFLDFSLSKNTYHSIFVMGGVISFIIAIVFLMTIISFITRQMNQSDDIKHQLGLSKHYIFRQCFSTFLAIIILLFLISIIANQIVFICLPSLYFYFSIAEYSLTYVMGFFGLILIIYIYLYFHFKNKSWR